MIPSAFVDKSQCRRRTIFPGVEIFTTAGSEMMLSLVEMQPHAIVQPHSHPHEQVGMVLEGEAEFFVGEERRQMQPGDFYRIPGGVVHKVVAGAAGAKALDIFHPVREDYL